jgi:hypothetical protein
MSTNNNPLPVETGVLKERKRPHEQEILRVVASLPEGNGNSILIPTRRQVLAWAQNKTPGILPQAAWEYKTFERLAGGRSCSAAHLESSDEDVWSLRIEDPDKTVAGRIWTTEINVSSGPGIDISRFTLRLSVSTTEERIDIEPHVPGVVLQIANAAGLWSGNYKLLDRPLRIKNSDGAEILFRALLDSARKVPIIAVSVPEGSGQNAEPLLDAKVLARACAGLAIVVVLAPEVSWLLTERFGKQLSVYNGAARVYLPGFTEDANPFGGHELLLPHGFENPDVATRALTRLRWIAAAGSVRRTQLGTDLLAFSAIKAQELQRRQIALQHSGATAQEQLDAANTRILLLQNQLEESRNYEQQFSDLHQEAEQRSEAAEAQVRAYAFRIQQLQDELKSSGTQPDAQIVLPTTWEAFANWCDVNLAGRLALSPQARRTIKSAEFEDIVLAARCLLWLANDYREAKINGGDGALRDASVENGVMNAHCGKDSYEMDWQGKKRDVEWHVKNGGNTRDPVRCLRIYFFWDESSLQVVVAYMPAHRRTDAS